MFNLCPLFLLLVIAALCMAELDAAALGLPPPHRGISILAPFFALMVFGVPFALAAKPRGLRHWVNVLSAALILPMGNSIMPWASAQTIRLLPHIYDLQVVYLDATFGVQPSFMVADIFTRYPAFATICMGIYAAVIFPAALVGAMEAHYGRRMGLGALPTFLVIAGVGFAIYHILPVVGPAPYFAGAFPFVSEHNFLPAPRNAMPSLHTAWVLMAFLATRGMSLPIRLITASAAVGTMIATLGTGEHYLTDLVVACPFVLLVRALCASELPLMARARMGSFLVGAALLVVWGLAVRGVIAPPPVPGLVPLTMLATVAISIRWERNLARAAGMLGVMPYLAPAAPSEGGMPATRA